MAAPQEKQLLISDWDVWATTMHPAPLSHAHFGLSAEDVDFLIKKFTALGAYADNENGEFTLRLLKTLVQYLYETDFDTSKISESVKQLRTSEGHNNIVALQHAINSLIPPAIDSFRVEINGQFDEQTKRALNYLIEQYHLKSREPNEKLTGQLQEISSRVIRLYPNPTRTSLTVPYDPFCFISPLANKFAIAVSRTATIIGRIKDGVAIAELRGEIVDDQLRPRLLNVFSKWFALLQLQVAPDDLVKTLQLPSQIENARGNQNYIADIQSSFELTSAVNKVSIGFSNLRPHFYFIGIFFSDNMRFRFINGIDLEEKVAGDIITFEPGNFYDTKQNPDRAVLIRGDAKILKICGVSRELGAKLVSLSDENAFYELMSAGERDLFSTINIGLAGKMHRYLLSIILGDVGHGVLIGAVRALPSSKNVEIITYNAARSGDFEVLVEEETLFFQDLRAAGTLEKNSYNTYIRYTEPEFALKIITQPERLHHWLQLVMHNSNLPGTNATFGLNLFKTSLLDDSSEEVLIDMGEPNRIIMDYERQKGNWVEPSFQLRIKNTSSLPFFVYCIYLGYDLSVRTDSFSVLNIAPGLSAWLTFESQGVTSQVIKLQLDDVCQQMGLTEITEYIKLIITTEQINIRGLAQTGVTSPDNLTTTVPEVNISSILPENAEVLTLAFNIRKQPQEKPKAPRTKKK
jgi:hypothetical protein